MSQYASTDYSKIIPLIPAIKKVANEFEGEDRKAVLELLIRDALGKTASEIVSESRQISAPNPPQQEINQANKELWELPTTGHANQIYGKLDTSKIEAFMKRHSISQSDLEKLFLQSDEKVERLYATLNTTKKSEAQVRVALLKCLSNAIQSRGFMATMEDVMSECKEFGIYDTNLSKNLKSRQRLFAVLDKKEVRLNAEGEKELAELVKELTKQEM